MSNSPYSLFSLIRGEHDAWLWEKARTLRGQYWNRSVFLRGIVEFSNYCRQNCLYCGLRRENTLLARYRLSPDEIFAQARIVAELGFGTLVLQSGEDPALDAVALATLISRIKDHLGLAVTLSLGERPHGDYAMWRKAGADRYLLKMETFARDAHTDLRPGKSVADRLRAYQTLRDLDYEAGSGLIGGLPGETPERLLRDLEQLADLKPDMLSISPFIPHPETPLAHHPALEAEAALRLMAIARLMVPSAHIPVTSALSLRGGEIRGKALEVGDVLMPSLTPERVREQYNIYPGKNLSSLEPQARAAAMRDSLHTYGFETPPGPGSAWRVLGN